MGRFIGYARVSTDDQELHLQIDALVKTGVDKNLIYKDKVSGAKKKRPGLDECLKELNQGDTLVVWKLDRLGRSMRHLIQIVNDLKDQGIGFKSICDGAIDTTSASGEFVFNIFSALAQYERGIIQERTKAGLAAARARGRMGGRKALSADDPKVIAAKTMSKNQEMSVDNICKTLDISRATYYRWLKT